MRALLIIIALSVLLFAGSALHADGTIRDAMGARTTGRGGANIGFADNGQMLLDNPAAIVNMPGFRLTEIGVDLLFTDLEFTDPDNPGGVSAEDNPFPAGQIVIASRSPDGSIGYGLGVFSQAGFASEYTMNGPFPFSGPQHYKSIGALARILPSVSYRVNDRLSVGGNFGVAVNHMELEGPYTLQGPSPFAGTPTRFDFQATGAAISWALAMQYQLTPATRLGVTYQAETSFELDGSTVTEIPGLGSSRWDAEADVDWPQYIGLGLQHDFNCCLRGGVDVVWFDWSSAWDSFDIVTSNPDNPVFQSVVGNTLNESFPLSWRDTVSVRTGLERDIGCGRVIRCGYVYHRSPVPDSTLTPWIQTTLEHAFSVGYGWQVMGNEIDLAYQYSFGDDSFISTSSLLGGDFDNSTVATEAHWLSLSMIRRY
ncbi:MAG: outer membrane protein transport protein [Planctomycetota bacterium]